MARRRHGNEFDFRGGFGGFDHVFVILMENQTGMDILGKVMTDLVGFDHD